MARIDELSIFSYRQVIDGDTTSTYALPLTAAIDLGAAPMKQYATIIVTGAFTSDLNVQLMGCNDLAAFSDGEVLAETGTLKSGDLVAGFKTHLQIPPTGKKYQAIYLKYISGTGGTDGAAHAEPDPVCPVDPVLTPVTAPANSVTAFYGTVADFKTEYPYANADKATN